MTSTPVNADAARPRLLGISGSLRRASTCTAILRTLAEMIAPEAELTVFPLNDIPLYNADEDGDAAPQAVRDLKQAVADADGLIVISPEYNYGMSGVIKNALDWASRPAMRSPLKGKPALIMTASPAYTGGVRAQAQLRETLAGTLARVLARPQVVIANANDKMHDGRLADEVTLRFAREALHDLLREIRLLARAGEG